MESDTTKRYGQNGNAGAALYGALLKAQKDMGSVQKDARNTFNNFDYASAEAMVHAARSALIANGLLLIREWWDYRMDAQTAGEGTYPSATVKCGMAIAHPESGEKLMQHLTFPALARKGTPIDKSVAAALTSSLAYWLRDVLLVPRGDFGKIEDHDDSDYGGFSAEDAFSKCVDKLAQRTGNKDGAAGAVRQWMENFADTGDDRPNKDDFAALWGSIGRGEMDAIAKGETDPLADLAGGQTNGTTNQKGQR